MNRRTLLTVGCFLALALVSALVAGRLAQPRVTGLMLGAAALATLTGGAGVLHRRAWPAALFLLPLGAYFLARSQIALPADASGLSTHVTFYAHQVGSGATTYVHETFPLDGGAADLRLLLSLVVYAIVWIAAFFALSLRRPLPAVVLLLFLAGFAFTTDQAARSPLPALAFVVLAGGLLALSRPRRRERVRVGDAVAGGATAIVAAVLALSILGATTVEAGRPLGDWRTWDIVGPSSELMGFDWMQNYPRLLSSANDAVVMEVRSPVASYWRANVLSEFSGSLWHSALESQPLPVSADKDSWSYALPPVDHGLQGRVVTQHFFVQSTYTDHLFAGGIPLEVSAPLALDLSANSAGAVSVDPARGPKTSYAVTAFVPDLGPTDLVGRGRYYPEEVTQTYLQLPFSTTAAQAGSEQRWRASLSSMPDGEQWADLYALNERIVGDETDPYRVALALQQYLRTNYDYSLRPPAGDFASPYASFLFQTRTGFCQHFAGSMALLLRFNGIPARVAVGFKEGRETKDGVFAVRRNDAHAWVETYFPGVGWAPFDPTPGHQLPNSTNVSGSGAGATGSPAAAAGGGPAGALARPGGPGRGRVADPGGPGSASAALSSGSARLPWAVAALAVLVGWPAGRALLRRRGLLGASLDQRVRWSVSALYAVLADHGVSVPPSQTLDETAQLLRDRYDLDAGDLPERVQAVLFGGRTATAREVAELQDLRRRLRKVLRARTGRLRSFAGLYGLRAAQPAA